MLDTRKELLPGSFPQLQRRLPSILQVNLGYLCNQSCKHCHVNAGPRRTEIMASETVDQVLALLQMHDFETLDLTGGAPELNPEYRRLVLAAAKMEVQIIDRCNLTVLLEPGQSDLAEFLAENHVHVISSMPCYLQQNVDRQRGAGVHKKSIAGLRMLNQLGYGSRDSSLPLDLVFNPLEPVLPGSQVELEQAYKQHLWSNYGIVFNRLLTIANMPIKRFGSMLLSQQRFHAYLDLLKHSHREENLDQVMCKDLISIDWQGYVYDCDFNQMLELPLSLSSAQRLHIRDLDVPQLRGQSIQVGDHCYACTAGQGSSCGGALA